MGIDVGVFVCVRVDPDTLVGMGVTCCPGPLVGVLVLRGGATEVLFLFPEYDDKRRAEARRMIQPNMAKLFGCLSMLVYLIVEWVSANASYL